MTPYKLDNISYTHGYMLIAQTDIRKRDIILLCELLNDEYENLCFFIPEAKSEGGIKYNFINEGLYTAVRLGLRNDKEWPWVNKDVMTEWKNNDDIILEKNKTISTFLKSFHGAPLFTLEELKLWEKCFNAIGLKRLGRYPRKKDLSQPK